MSEPTPTDPFVTREHVPATDEPDAVPTRPPSPDGSETATVPPIAPAPDTAPETRSVSVPGYEILGKLGEGGMGIVYKARQLAADRVVAMKMILGGGHVSADLLTRFRTEAKAIARLQHPNIVQVYDVGECDGLPYFSLEFCPGGTLAKKLSGTPLPPREAAGLVETLARAMHAAHQAQIIHRDLKPANVLLAADGTPKITDFGLAKKIDEAGQTASGAIMGTPSYMAPEQAGGKSAIGPAADVYALGAILYECLVGRPPFKGPTAVDTILQVISDEPVPPTQLQSKVPRDLETICLKCLQKEPARRYASAAELADDLRRYQAGEPIAARPVGIGERAVKWVRRRPAMAASLSAAAVLAVVSLGGIGYALQKDAQYKIDSANKETVHQTEIANQERENTREQERLTKEAQSERDKAEAILARSLLRPLGHGTDAIIQPVNQIELDALWELAESPGDRVRLLFVQRALDLAGTLRQLRNRREHAMHAAIGLDRSRRQRAAAVLLARLRDERVDTQMRTDCVLVRIALGDPNPEFVVAAARTLTDQMAQTGDLRALAALAQGLEAVSARLDADDAAAAARVLTDWMAKTDNPVLERALAQGLEAVSARLDADDTAKYAAVAARALTNQMAKTNYPFLEPMAQGLGAVSARLDAKDAAKYAAAAARVLTDRMAKTDKSDALRRLAQGLGAVSPRLDAEDAAKYAAAAARVLTDQMAKTADPNDLAALAQGLEEVSARLDAEDAAAAARVLTNRMAKQINSQVRIVGINPVLERAALAQGFRAVSARLDAKDAAAAARVLTDAIAKTADSYTLPALAQGLGAMSVRLGAEDAAAAARAFTDRMTKTDDPDALRGLAQGLEAVSAELAAEEAAKNATVAARVLTNQMAKTDNPNALAALAQGLGAVSARLDAEDAAKYAAAAARVLTNQMAKMEKGFALAALAQGLGAVSARLDAEDAAKYAAAAARALTDQIAKTADPYGYSLAALAQGLGAVSARLSAEDAAKYAGVAARALIDQMTKTHDPYALGNLAHGLEALSARLDAKDAVAAACVLTDATAKTVDANALHYITESLWAALEERPGPNEVQSRAVLAARAIGESLSSPNRLPGLTTLVQASQPLPSRLSTQQMVDLLKMPTCVGPARIVVLEMLGQRYHRAFADQWEFVEYAEKHLPEIDLKSPPKRPQP
jgi:hypothetical protein